jgi:hypothetical protein
LQAVSSDDELYPGGSMILFMKGLDTRRHRASASAAGRKLLANNTVSVLDRWPSFAKGAAAPNSRGADMAHERRLTQVIRILDNFPRVTPQQIRNNACSGCRRQFDIFRYV